MDTFSETVWQRGLPGCFFNNLFVPKNFASPSAATEAIQAAYMIKGTVRVGGASVKIVLTRDEESTKKALQFGANVLE